MNGLLTSVIALLIATVAGGVMALMTQAVADRRRMREDRGREQSAAKDEVLRELADHRATLAYHSGLLELLCRRFDISTARAVVHAHRDERKARDG